MDNLIMLPTGKPERKGDLLLTEDGRLFLAEFDSGSVKDWVKTQHLYQIAKHRIVYGDHYLMNMDGKADWELMEANSVEDALRASPDPGLGLPGIDPEVIANLINGHNA